MTEYSTADPGDIVAGYRCAFTHRSAALAAGVRRGVLARAGGGTVQRQRIADLGAPALAVVVEQRAGAGPGQSGRLQCEPACARRIGWCIALRHHHDGWPAYRKPHPHH